MQTFSERGKYPYEYINLPTKANYSKLWLIYSLPIRWEAHQTVEQITSAEVADQDEDWLPHVSRAGPSKLPLDSLGAGDHIEEGEKDQGVGQNADGLHHPNDRQVETPKVRN